MKICVLKTGLDLNVMKFKSHENQLVINNKMQELITKCCFVQDTCRVQN